MAALVWCDFPQARGFDPFTHCGANEPDSRAEESAKPGPPIPWGEQTRTGKNKRGKKTEEDQRGQEGEREASSLARSGQSCFLRGLVDGLGEAAART